MRNDTAYRTTKAISQAISETSGYAIARVVSTTVLIGFLFAGLIMLSNQANAQTVMHGQEQPVDRSDVVEQLDAKHHEAPVARGLGANGAMFEVFAKDDGGTWTIIMTLPDGSSRMLAAGEHWTNVPILTAKGPKI